MSGPWPSPQVKDKHGDHKGHFVFFLLGDDKTEVTDRHLVELHVHWRCSPLCAHWCKGVKTLPWSKSERFRGKCAMDVILEGSEHSFFFFFKLNPFYKPLCSITVRQKYLSSELHDWASLPTPFCAVDINENRVILWKMYHLLPHVLLLFRVETTDKRKTTTHVNRGTFFVSRFKG